LARSCPLEPLAATVRLHSRYRLPGRLVQVLALVHVPIRIVVLVVKYVIHHVRMNPLVLEKTVRLLNIDKIVYDLIEYSGAPLLRKRLGKLLGLGEPLIQRVAENLVALVFPRVIVPLFPNLVEPLEVDGCTAHRAPRPSALQVPRLYTTAAEVVPARKLLEGALFTVAHRALVSHLERWRDFVLKLRKS